MLQKQPLYIKGTEDPGLASQGCYGGGKNHLMKIFIRNFDYLLFCKIVIALIYLGFALVSIAYWVIHNMTTAAAAKLAEFGEKRKSGKSEKKRSKKFEGGNYGSVQEDEL